MTHMIQDTDFILMKFMFSLNTLLKVTFNIFCAKEVTCYSQSKMQYSYMIDYIVLYVEH